MWLATSFLLQVCVFSVGSYARPTAQGETMVSVFVSVTDANGRPSPGLQPNDFVVRVDGEDIEVASAEVAKEPVSLAVVVASDAQDFLPIDGSVKFIGDWLSRQPGARVGLTRSEDFGVTFRDSPDRGVLASDYSHTFINGVELLPGIEGASKALSREGNVRRIVLAIAKFGWVDVVAQGTTPAKVRDALRGSQSSLWAVTIEPATASGSSVWEQTLTDGAKLSGGRALSILNTSSLVESVQRLVAEISAQYVIRFHRPMKSPSDQLRIGVKRSNVTVAAPTWIRH